jgi:hypothetical protein
MSKPLQHGWQQHEDTQKSSRGEQPESEVQAVSSSDDDAVATVLACSRALVTQSIDGRTEQLAWHQGHEEVLTSNTICSQLVDSLRAQLHAAMELAQNNQADAAIVECGAAALHAEIDRLQPSRASHRRSDKLPWHSFDLPRQQALLAGLQVAYDAGERVRELMAALQQQLAALAAQQRRTTATVDHLKQQLKQERHQAAIAAQQAADSEAALRARLAPALPLLQAAQAERVAAAEAAVASAHRIAQLEEQLAVAQAETTRALAAAREQEMAAAKVSAALEARLAALLADKERLQCELKRQAEGFAQDSARLCRGLDAANNRVGVLSFREVEGRASKCFRYGWF